ncbi:uncharacterized protein P884DRAFT_74008 [Thermothelomyces heterothallicus CBS 202.75]|uniref:uncharacterized protein n=1 Tax=Thermothelomyces heterothallicus CBS 202.75 TaxID=1149848 RepID=UPI003742873C
MNKIVFSAPQLYPTMIFDIKRYIDVITSNENANPQKFVFLDVHDQAMHRERHANAETMLLSQCPEYHAILVKRKRTTSCDQLFQGRGTKHQLVGKQQNRTETNVAF